MWNFQRIICIWICCVSCMFGTTQLSTALVQAVPYEYFDDHDQSFYDLDTEQIQAKYDTRLLSQQMLPSTENLKGFHNSAPFHTTNTLLSDDGSHRNALEMRKQNDAAFMYGSTAKLKSNDGAADGNERNNDFIEQMEETATKAASSTSAFTESLDELHLPRAASCFTNGQKYTHGQKVPRLDNCEVCLCMDGEIFCWWEKCDKKAAKALTTYDDYSTPFEESSTTRMQLSPKTTFKSTLKPMKKLKTTTTTNEDYKYDDDDSAEIREMQQEYEGLKEQLAREEHTQEREREREQEHEHEEVRLHEPHKNHNKQMAKKKIYQQQAEEKYNNKKIKEENQKQKQKQEMEPHRTQQQQQKLKSNEHYEHQHHARNHNGNSRHRDNGSSGASSKIFKFPENLPSVLYYDYKTEEHHQHQHQYREQHLKHQKQKQQQQHEKELKQRQQQKLLQKQQLQQEQQQKQQKLQPIQRHHNNRHHEYGQVFHTYNLPDKSLELAELGNGGVGGPSTTFKYFSTGNKNIYNGGDLLSDSDILPEPPTKKTKILTITMADTTDMAKTTTATPLSQIYRVLTAATAVTTMPSGKSSNTPTTTIIASTPLKKEILSSWDSNKPNNNKMANGNNNSTNNGNSNGNSDSKANRNNESTEDLMDTDDQDDAFHRWLTAPDTNNKNYLTFNESTSMSGVGGFDGTNSDYNGDERNYENIGFDTETGFSSASVAADTKATINVMATAGATKNMEAAAASIYSDDVKANGMHENEQHGNGNGNDNYINMASSNGIINGNGNSNNNNNNFLPFSQTYENFNRNNNLYGSNTTTASGGSGGNSNESGGGGGGVGIVGSTVSNEDNGVASVVNIDIMLTASSAELQQQQQPQSNINIQATNEQQQQQQKEQHFEHEKQIGKTPNEFMQPPSVLISNRNDIFAVGVGALVKSNTLFSKIYDNSSNSNSSNSNNNKNFTNILDGNQNIETQNWGVNLSNNNSNGNTNTITNNNNNNATSYSSSSSSDSFKFKHLPTVLVSQTTATTSSTATAVVASAIPPTLSTTSSPERQCNVMGTLYKIGDVLPQDTGNCLQCICIDGSTSDDTPRVTCSPHNCPPLVLPDLFDATGY